MDFLSRGIPIEAMRGVRMYTAKTSKKVKQINVLRRVVCQLRLNTAIRLRCSAKIIASIWATM